MVTPLKSTKRPQNRQQISGNFFDFSYPNGPSRPPNAARTKPRQLTMVRCLYVHAFARSTAFCQRARRSARSVALHLRLKAHIALSFRAQRFGAGPEARRQPGEIRRAQRRRLCHPRPHHRNAQHVGLELHQQIVHRRAAVDAQRLERRVCLAVHGFQHVGHLEGDGFERRTRNVSRAGVAPAGRSACRPRARPSAERRGRQTPAQTPRRSCLARSLPAPPLPPTRRSASDCRAATAPPRRQ